MSEGYWRRECRPRAGSPNGVQVYLDGRPVKLIRRSEAIKLEHMEIEGKKIAQWRGRHRFEALTLLCTLDQLRLAIHVMRHFRLRAQAGAIDNVTCIRIPGPVAYRFVPERVRAYSVRERTRFR
jgi:hypothetical protein